MFTQSQMLFMLRVQSADDWHCSYFIQALKEYHANPTDDWLGVVTIEESEFQALLSILAKATLNEIFDLQMGLNCFNLLNYKMFETDAIANSPHLPT